MQAVRAKQSTRLSAWSIHKQSKMQTAVSSSLRHRTIAGKTVENNGAGPVADSRRGASLLRRSASDEDIHQGDQTTTNTLQSRSRSWLQRKSRLARHSTGSNAPDTQVQSSVETNSSGKRSLLQKNRSFTDLAEHPLARKSSSFSAFRTAFADDSDMSDGIHTDSDFSDTEEEASAVSPGRVANNIQTFPRKLNAVAIAPEEDCLPELRKMASKEGDTPVWADSPTGRRQALAAIAGCGVAASGVANAVEKTANPLTGFSAYVEAIGKTLESLTPRLGSLTRRGSGVSEASGLGEASPTGRRRAPDKPSALDCTDPEPACRKLDSFFVEPAPASPTAATEKASPVELAPVGAAVAGMLGAEAPWSGAGHSAAPSSGAPRHDPVLNPDRVVPCDWMEHSAHALHPAADAQCVAADAQCVAGDDGLCVVDPAFLPEAPPLPLAQPPPAHKHHSLKALSHEEKELESITEMALQDNISFKGGAEPEVVARGGALRDMTNRPMATPSSPCSKAAGAGFRGGQLPSMLSGLAEEEETLVSPRAAEDSFDEGKGEESFDENLDEECWRSAGLEMMTQAVASTVIRLGLMNLMEDHVDIDALWVHPFLLTLVIGVVCTMGAQLLADLAVLWASLDPEGGEAGAGGGERLDLAAKVAVVSEHVMSAPSLKNMLRYTCFSRLYLISLSQVLLCFGWKAAVGPHLPLHDVAAVRGALDSAAEFASACAASVALSKPLMQVQTKAFRSLFRQTLSRQWTPPLFLILDVAFVYQLHTLEPFLHPLTSTLN